MGILDRLTARRATSLLSASADLGIVSPWQPAPELLPAIVVEDALGAELKAKLPLTRAEAMRIPAVAKARHLLVSTVAKFPLRAMRGEEVLPDKDQPSWLYRTDGPVTPYDRMAWTVDDLCFYGVALWLVQRGATPTDGTRAPIINAEFLPQQYWTITNGHILVNEEPVDESEVILFNPPFEGLLALGSTTLRGAQDIEKSWVGRARNPIPALELHQLDDTLTQPEVTEFVKAWSAARRSPDGSVGYTPPSIELRTHGEVDASLMIEGRNAVRTDVGSFLNVRAAMLDGTIGVDSLTYSTKEGERNSFYEFDLPMWTDPIEARLSMDDVVPRGQRVRFEKYGTTTTTPAETGPTVQD